MPPRPSRRRIPGSRSMPAAMPSRIARVLRSAHERGIADGAAPAEVRELVAASWRRSLVAGVAPIHDPSTGELIGVVDLTAALRTARPQTLSLVAHAARAAEVTLRVHQLEQAQAFRERWEAAIAGRRVPSLLLDARGQVIASRGIELPPTRMESGPEADNHVRSPDGRIWERQPLRGGAAILWLRRPSARRPPRLSLRPLGGPPCARLGARAEHGLRSHLGERVIETQPYRLRRKIDADWLEVQRRLGEGAPRSALAAYSGALLNGTTIVGTRADLREVFELHAAGRTHVTREVRPLDQINESIEL